MSNELKKNNHYIPQMIMKNFTNDDQKIYEFYIDKKQWHLPNGIHTDGGMTTFGVAKEKSLYIKKNEQGELTDIMEENFAYLENGTMPIIKKMIELKTNSFFNDTLYILDDDEHIILMLFLAVGWLRTPNNLNMASQALSGLMLNLFVDELTLNNPSLPEKYKNISYINDNFIMSVCNQTVLNCVFSKDTIVELTEELSKFQWILINNNTNLNFLIGDGFLSLDHVGITHAKKIFVPLGNKKALLGTKELNIFYNNEQEKRKIISEFNFHAIKNSKKSVFSSIKSDSIKNYIIKHIHNNNISMFDGKSGKTYNPNCKRENVTHKIK